MTSTPEIARPLSEWHEDMGDALWWFFPMTQAPYVGSPRDCGRTCEVTLLLVGEEHIHHVSIVAGHRQCRQLRDDITELSLPSPKPRQMVATLADVVAARRAAHSLGLPSAALCYALQFETALRLWDVAGQWYPMDSPVVSAVIRHNKKWAGLEWRHISPDLVLRYIPTKTEHTSGAEVVFDLRLCPMVLEELIHFPLEKRTGPVVVFERVGAPYDRSSLIKTWRSVRSVAGLPNKLWSRDLRASAVTEARAAGSTNDDASKVAGHSKPRITAAVYDRANLEAHQRFQGARIGKRTTNDPENA